MKKCPKCGIDKPLTAEYYHRNSSQSSGFQSHCKVCSSYKTKKVKAEYYQNNKEKILNKAEYRQNNKERFLNTCRVLSKQQRKNCRVLSKQQRKNS